MAITPSSLWGASGVLEARRSTRPWASQMCYCFIKSVWKWKSTEVITRPSAMAVILANSHYQFLNFSCLMVKSFHSLCYLLSLSISWSIIKVVFWKYCTKAVSIFCSIHLWNNCPDYPMNSMLSDAFNINFAKIEMIKKAELSSLTS